MKKVLSIILIALLFLPFKVKGLESSGTCAIVMDQDSKRILYGKNINTVRSVASISKIMTALLAVESNKLDDMVTIGEEINDAYGSAIYIKVGEEISLRNLLYGLMLRSGNDAALAIAKYVGGSVEDFVKMMNEKASSIGMKNSLFHNPSGLDEEDEGNLSTAYDMAILTSYVMKNNDYKTIVSTKKHVVTTNMNTYSWTNKNRLLTSYKYTTGGKTGYTEIARRTLVTTASKDNINLVVVTLNNGNDFNEHKSFYDEIFSNYSSYEILKEGNINIYDEEYYQDYYLYINTGYRYLLNNDEKKNLYLKIEIEKKTSFKSGEAIGKVKVMMDNKAIYETDLFVVEKKKNKFSLIKWFRSLW